MATFIQHRLSLGVHSPHTVLSYGIPSRNSHLSGDLTMALEMSRDVLSMDWHLGVDIDACRRQVKVSLPLYRVDQRNNPKLCFHIKSLEETYTN